MCKNHVIKISVSDDTPLVHPEISKARLLEEMANIFLILMEKSFGEGYVVIETFEEDEEE